MKALALFALLLLASSIDASPCCPDDPAPSGSPSKAPRPDGLGFCTDACTCGCNAGEPCRCGLPIVHSPLSTVHYPEGGIDCAAMQDDCLDGECYRLNGVSVSRHRALNAVGDPSIPDDSKHWRVILVTSDEAIRRSFLIASEALAEFRARVVFQAFAPDAWQVKGLYSPLGDPSVYVVDAGGKLLTPAFPYTTPLELAGKLRKADPAFDPSKDPKAPPPKDPKDPKNPDAAAEEIDLAKVPTPYWVAAGLGVLLLFRKKTP